MKIITFTIVWLCLIGVDLTTSAYLVVHNRPGWAIAMFLLAIVMIAMFRIRIEE
jgi:hypothetical protein